MYVGTYLNRREGFLAVSERINGQRVMTQYPLVLEYLVPDSMGSEMGIDGKRLKKIELKDIGEYYSHKKVAAEGFLPTYELNFNLTNKVLYKYYKGCEAPVLHKMFFDIEVDYDPAVAGDMNTLVTKTPCAINAVSMYMDWLDKTITLALKPSSLSFEEAKKITDSLEDTYLFDDEKQLLDTMIKLFDDADVISGWNSDFFDIPYIIGRISKLFDQKKTAELCLWGQLPVAKEVETYGRLAINYSLIGKWSVDYMQLYKKHTPNEHESYSLDNIAFEELGDRKVKYEGTLTNLYFDDFKLFLEYNKQDTNLLARLDKKLNYINIHNRQAHSILVTLDATMGTVAWFDQAVINRAHDSNLYVPDRVEGKNMLWEGVRPPGAFVQDPVVGMHEWISDTDLNSLYPSTIRCLNMSPETIWGQIELTYTMPYLWQKIETKGLWKNKEKRIPSWTDAWGGDEMFGTLEYQMVMNQTEDMLTLATETGEKMDISAKDLYEVIFSDDSNVCLSAFGTLFRTDVQGIVPKILSEWYADRKTMKKKAYNYRCMKEGISILPSLSEIILKTFDKTKVTSKEIDYDISKLKEMVKANAVDDLITFMYDNGLTIVDNIIEPLNKSYYEEREAYWDLEQYLRKINLNSSYGALLNSGSTFYDFRLGASTTASGRKIVQHMASKLNELAVGEYKHKAGIVLYGDTDSAKSFEKQRIRRGCSDITLTFEELFNDCQHHYNDNSSGKEYGFTTDKFLTYNPDTGESEYKDILFVYRHKTSKQCWEIEDENNNVVTVTNDHSCMVERNGVLISIKPKDITLDDVLITLSKKDFKTIVRSSIKRCECVGKFDNEYVYDIGIKDEKIHNFFCDNILIHNSTYFSLATPEFKAKHPDFVYTKENVTKYVDEISKLVNDSYAEHVQKIFHVTPENAKIIQAAREIIATRGLYVSKKRYALMVFDSEGEHFDIHGKPGKLKIKGLQIQRSDTPIRVRNLLKSMMNALLSGKTKEDLEKLLKTFYEKEWGLLNPWEKGSPKAVNGLTKYTDLLKENPKTRVPGHVMASINYNRMLQLNNDTATPQILDGNKIVVCKLKPNNPFGMTSIAYPRDLDTVPEWFKNLPFAEEDMSDTIVDDTIESIFGILNWNLSMKAAINKPEDILEGILTFVD